MDNEMNLEAKTNSFVKRALLVIIGVFVLAFCLVFMYLNELGPFAYDPMFVPDYPNAQNVQIVVQEDLNTVSWTLDKPYKVVTFTTVDSPEQVFTFFKNTLLSRSFEGWRSNMVQEDPSSFSIVGFGHEEISPPMYTYSVTTEQKQGLTYVRVERYSFPGL